MKLLKDKVANFGKQNARITKQNKTGSKFFESETKNIHKMFQIVSLERGESLDQLWEELLRMVVEIPPTWHAMES